MNKLYLLLILLTCCTQNSTKPQGLQDTDQLSTLPFSTVEIEGHEIQYLDIGSGTPIVLLHGSPSSAYLWRHIVPTLKFAGRVLSVNVLPQTSSSSLETRTPFEIQYDIFQTWIKLMKIKRFHLIVHGTGCAQGFSFMQRNPGVVKSLVMMEGLCHFEGDENYTLAGDQTVKKLKTFWQNPKFAINDPSSVAHFISGATKRSLSKKDLDAYERSFTTHESDDKSFVNLNDAQLERTKTLLEKSFEYIKLSETPKLMLYGEPGMLWNNEEKNRYQHSFKRLKTQSVGPGLHYLPEDQPQQVAAQITNWILKNEQ